jgi:hypothetical protein
MRPNQPAFEVGQLAQRLADGYYGHMAAITVAGDPKAETLFPAVRPGQMVPVAEIRRKDGTVHTYHFALYLQRLLTDPLLREDLERVWLAGALLSLGDAMARHGYFDRAPELELVRHLRNGIAHGNMFRIDKSESLQRHPAHNRLAWCRGDSKEVFEITPVVQGRPVLFDFLAPGNVIDLLLSVALYLVRMGNGDPLRP